MGDPGLAKFGIALGLGPRDRGFESRSPDQKEDTPYGGILFLLCAKGFEPRSPLPQVCINPLFLKFLKKVLYKSPIICYNFFR